MASGIVAMMACEKILVSREIAFVKFFRGSKAFSQGIQKR